MFREQYRLTYTHEIYRHQPAREIIKMIEADGWYLVDIGGSHRQYKHPSKTGRVTIAGNLGHSLAPGTLNSILKQAKLKDGR
jgi:predicted RNA binding protein YcfA (HicA-like mRNA interferase family)